MIKIEGIKNNELEETIDLINTVFRTGRGNLPHTMEKEFPLLFSIENIENMRVIKDKDRKIVSVVSFLPKKILIDGIPVSTSSVGGVCTHSNHRGNRYSSLILKDVEEKMDKMGVSLCFVSSTRNLYKRWGTDIVNNSIKYRFLAKNSHNIEDNLDIEIREYKKSDLEFIKKLYNLEKTRYLRENNDFEILIESGTFPFGETSYKKYIVEEKDEIIGYIILEINKNKIRVKEAVGEKEKIFKTLKILAKNQEIKEIEYVLYHNESVPKGHIGEEVALGGSIKIINFKRLVEELKPYFYRYYSKEIVDSLEILEEKNKEESQYKIRLGEDGIIIKSHKELLELIFEKNQDKGMEKTKLREFLGVVFPISIPSTENLNYQ